MREAAITRQLIESSPKQAGATCTRIARYKSGGDAGDAAHVQAGLGDIYAGANVQDERELHGKREEQVQRSFGAWVLGQVTLALLFIF